MICRFASTVLLAAPIFLAACASQYSTVEPESRPQAVLSHGYAILHATLEDESRVAQSLIIKDADSDVAALLKDIAEFAGAAADRIEAFAKREPSLRLENQGLPRVEKEVRASIRGARTKQILLSSGKDFELAMLLAQQEALNYINHLARVLSEEDHDQTRREYLAQLAKSAKGLYERTVAQLAKR